MTQLQVSWRPGRVVAWGGGPGAPVAGSDDVAKMLDDAGAPDGGMDCPRPDPDAEGCPGRRARRAVGDILGWLVAAGADQVGDGVAPSVRWLGDIAIWAVELTAHGAMVPLLRQRKRRSGSESSSSASFAVRWTPALIDAGRLHEMADDMPGSVAALDPSVDARALTRSALTGMVDAICRDSARRIEVPAPPPSIRTASDVTEAFLARLDGSAFEAPLRVAADFVTKTGDWARSVTREHAPLVVRLDPPDTGNAWELEVFASDTRRALVPIEQAIVNARSDRGADRRDLEDELARLERMLPALHRPGGKRRGQVVLSQDEAWELMTEGGPRLASAGFDVRVPELSLRRATPTLRVFADASSTSAVGASQLADVRWSAVFDDVELTAADIAQLAKEARPLIRSGGRWVAIDRADLDAAAAALAERATTTQLSGADMLRLALGSRGFTARGRVLGRGRGLGRRPAGGRDERVGRARRRPAGLRRRSAQLPGRGVGVAPVPRLGRDRRMPRARHGTGQDADDARSPARGRRQRPDVGDRPGRRRRQLGRGGGPVHPRPARRRAPRREPRRRRRHRRRRRGSRRRDHHLRNGGARRRGHREGRLGPRDPRRGAGDQERGERHRAAAPADPRDLTGRARPARPSRTGSATSGPSSTSRTPDSSVPDRSSSPRCPAKPTRRAPPRTRCGPSTASSCSAARRRNR